MKKIRFTNVRELQEEIFKSGLEQFIFVFLDDRKIEFDENAEQRLIDIAEDSDASITYCNYRERTEDGKIELHPVIDYQIGSVRDDFDFGPVVLLNIADVLSASEDFTDESDMADGGWYALRLRLSIRNLVAAVPEYLYTVEKKDYRKSGEKQHDYVDPKAREYQLDMEDAFYEHLADINALVSEEKEIVDFDVEDFDVEASVVIPVKNRIKTIGDAVKSALEQKTTFSFNIIIVDNGSTDGTSDYLDLLMLNDSRIKVIKLTGEEGLGIGGCWNKALLSEYCGRFAIQLDSDDLYSSPDTLQRIVDKFYEENAAMVIGTYRITDFNLNTLPPGIIDHKEWTVENGANNALRINGFGAPRAFFTPIARRILFPNVSYGEDYAMCLRISRDYPVGRIYDVIYDCRRWDGNSDASLSIEQVNAHNSYKDFLRSVEILARIKANNEFPDTTNMDDDISF